MRRPRVNLSPGYWHYDSAIDAILSEHGEVICLMQNLSEIDPEDFPVSEFRGNMQAICALPDLLLDLRTLLSEMRDAELDGVRMPKQIKEYAKDLAKTLEKLTGQKLD